MQRWYFRAKLLVNDMLIYFLLLIGSMAVGIPLCRVKHGKKIYCVLFGVIFFIVAALRYDVGYDYNLYGNWYVQSQLQSVEDIGAMKQEKGFLIPMKLLSDVFSDYQVMFVLIAAVFAVAVMLYIYHNSEKPYWSVFCFLAFGLFFNSMNFMRQMIAAVIIVYAFRYIKKKQYFRFLIMTLFASVFHVSALIMVVFYFLLRIKMNWISLGVYSAVMLIYMLFSEKLINFITRYVYTGYKLGSNPEITNGVNPIYTVFFGIFFVTAFLLRKRLCKKDSFNNVLINCMFFTFFFECMGIKHGVISRFSVLFFIPAVTVLVPGLVEELLEVCKEKFGKDHKRITISRTAVLALFVSVCTGMYSYMVLNNYNGISPYKTVITERGAENAEQ